MTYEPWPHRYAVLYRGNKDWNVCMTNGWTRISDIEAWFSVQVHQILKLQVFDSEDNLIMNRTVHDLLEEVTNG